ncbi:phage tail sheath C-terminal domain-containing protein [Streptomyces sp. UNOB3_S3]|uniref:phage tail sheath family protein n=1 Tax=Streptomyces sp. UNOB3_S3 TaxID=2871682 RepID=UPI001E5A09D1|nr:phage tail sheath C-terminal domain-containing protein [Streptomyces sp. UNOB3_S3]MCC3773402.1 phage tail sheath subtilisin-like domain-containing protein [Streptomyces sp. UNOB3_S3]
MVARPPAPGVFVTERTSGVRTITGVGTSTPAFLGYTVGGPEAPTPPTLIRSWSEFVDTFHFRSPLGRKEIERALDGMPEAVEEAIATLGAEEDALRHLATTGAEPVATTEEFDKLVAVRTADWAGEPVGDADRREAEAVALKVSTAFPEDYAQWIAAGDHLASLCRRRDELVFLEKVFEQADTVCLHEAVYGFFANGGSSCYILRLDPTKDLASEVDGNPDKRTGLAGLKSVPDVNMVAVPDLWHKETPPETAAAIIGKVIGHCVTMRNRLTLCEPPPDTAPDAVSQFLTRLAGPDSDDAAFTALYYPWVEVAGVDGVRRTVPPSGHLAGVWARTDAERGVFKAPANQNLRGVISLPTLLTDRRHGELNDKGVNCLRTFPDRGLLVWGARTRSGSRDWRYLNVRRLVSFLSDSIRQSTTWAVFEPNDDRLWATLGHSVGSFLTDQWRQGALLGRTPDEAFYVICDRTNNTSATIDAGKVICDIGVAPVRPAEFVHFTITQIAGQPGATT